MTQVWKAKNPALVADYEVNWAGDLTDDTISTSTFELVVTAGLAKDSETHTATTATVWLSGGTAGGVATLKNTITTTGGRTYVEDILLPISGGLVVEDGSGLANAESYVSVEDAVAYCAAHNLAFVGTTAEQAASLRAGFEWLNRKGYKGERVKGRGQAGAFPRSGCTDGEGADIAIDEVPFEMVSANVELAVFDRANPGGLSPNVTMTDRVRRVREGLGPLQTETEYAAAPSTPDAARPVLTRVDDLIGGLIDGGGNPLVGEAVRS